MATATKSAKKTTLRPMFDRVIIKPSTTQERTSSGIILPDSAREKPMQGKVIAAGPGRLNEDDGVTPLSISVGDTVVYGKYSGTEIEINGDTLVILRESELLGKLD